VPLRETDIREMEAELRPSSRVARLERSGLVLAPGELDSVGGLFDTQSWTNNDTRGLASRLSVFREEGGVVMMTVGELEKGVEGR